MRVGVVGLLHESNTCIAARTTVEHFRQDLLLTEPAAIRDAFAAAHHEVGGFLEGLDAAGIEAVPLLAARAVPGGVIDAASADWLCRTLFERLDAAGRLDGLLVAPHGAAVAENAPDFDGHWLSELRRRVGAEVPVVCTIDPHANLSPRMVEACDATIAYRTNPHLDQRDRGREAAALIARTLRGEVRPVQAASFPPVAINIERQFTAEPPCADLAAAVEEVRRRPGVLGASLVLGFPYADVPEMGSSFVVVTDGDRRLAQSLADELAGRLVRDRQKFAGHFVSVEQAIAEGRAATGPVCLLDTGDNVGGGSPGDGTLLPAALLKEQGWKSFAKLFDPDSAAKATAAGVGATVELTVGGKTDALHGPPIAGKWEVLRLHDGQWRETQVRHGGASGGAMGPCAVVRSSPGGALTLLLTSRRTPPFSLQPLLSSGVNPWEFNVLVAKGVHAPVAAYREVCRHFVRVNTPGSTDADMRRLPFARRRRPMFPFEPLD